MNKWCGIGRLTKDPDVRYTQDNKAVARFTLAVDRHIARNANGNTQTADFIPVVAWEKKAEFAEKYLHQGSKIAVVGRIATSSYTDREGRKVYTTDIVAEELEFAESKQASATKEEPKADSGFVSAPDLPEDLPFN